MSHRIWQHPSAKDVGVTRAVHFMPGPNPSKEPIGADTCDPLQQCCFAVHQTLLNLGINSVLYSGHGEPPEPQFGTSFPELAQVRRASHAAVTCGDLRGAAVFVYEPGALLPAALTNARLVVYVANTLPTFDRDALVVGEMMRFADAVVYPTKEVATHTSSRVGRAGHALGAMFPHDVDPSPTLCDRNYDLLWVGRDVKRKNLDGFIELVRSTRVLRPDVHAKVISTVDENRARQLRQAGIDCLSGRLDRRYMSNVFSTTKQLVHTATLESSPRVIIEALVHGCEVVVPEKTENGWATALLDLPGVVTEKALSRSPDFDPEPTFARRLSGLGFSSTSPTVLDDWHRVWHRLLELGKPELESSTGT